MVGETEHMPEFMDERSYTYRKITLSVHLLRYRIAVDGNSVDIKLVMCRLQVVAVRPYGISDRGVSLTVPGIKTIHIVDHSVAVGIEISEIHIVLRIHKRNGLLDHFIGICGTARTGIVRITAVDSHRSEHAEIRIVSLT